MCCAAALPLLHLDMVPEGPRQGAGVDVFRAHDRLIDDYRSFTTSFVDIADQRVKDHVAAELAEGKQWQEP